jgi:dTDP-4-amino-4,6-dideoxygalactose transaminase
LGGEHISLLSNGTLALITAISALGIKGEVITTPYSFVATSHALLWNGLKPVFVDIDPTTFNLDASKIEEAITPETSAILPVHCYGHPCNVTKIDSIAEEYGLKVIYDAAHAFGVDYGGKSLASYGDVSALSFHATKVFNTFEGGALICRDENLKEDIDYLKNFGIADEVTVVTAGINAKMNEFQAALGLLQLEYIEKAIEERARIDGHYRNSLAQCEGLKLHELPVDTKYNFSYFPILIENEFPVTRDELFNRLREQGVMARRYFYPLISDMPMYRESSDIEKRDLSVAKKVADEIICLPLYPGLSEADQARIVEIVTTSAVA